jgi:hypothetical protein
MAMSPAEDFTRLHSRLFNDPSIGSHRSRPRIIPARIGTRFDNALASHTKSNRTHGAHATDGLRVTNCTGDAAHEQGPQGDEVRVV